MATITSELVTEYFSELNLSKAPFTMIDEFIIPQYLNTKDAKRWLAKMFELSWGDYYKFTMNQLMKKHHD